jgi:hypothetical protein
LDEQDQFWRRTFEQESLPDDRSHDPVSEPVFSLQAAVLPRELDEAIRSQGDGAPGKDGIRREDLKHLDVSEYALRCSLWLACGMPPSAFREGYTSLAPKSVSAREPGEYRPITVSSMLARVFHRVISKRMERGVPLNERQKAFRSGDGLRDNIWILRTLIRSRTRRTRPLCIAFIDVAKAFDSVSHHSMLSAAKRLGVPSRLLDYVQSLYKGSVTQLKVGGVLGQTIRVGRGVRQGDPLSALLFNYVMDLALSSLDPKLGVRLGQGVSVNHLAFADDVALIAETAVGLRSLASAFERALALVGLRPNPKKSATLEVRVDGKGKRWVCGVRGLLNLGGEEVRPLTVAESYRYLGTHATLGCKVPSDCEAKLRDGLSNISKAPLKPQQRLFVLRTQLIPSLYHEMVLGDRVTLGCLRQLDKFIRKTVRGWLRLPHDSPVALFYADADDGGLGLDELSVLVPLLRRQRLDRLFDQAGSGSDPVLRWCCDDDFTLRRARVKWDNVKARGMAVGDRRQWRLVNGQVLHDSVDGRGLRGMSDVRGIARWRSDGNSTMSGRSFIGAVQLTSGTLSTRLRSARGHPDASTSCDCCGRVESLGHILQVCERTSTPRIARHNRILELVSSKLKSVGWKVVHEPSIRTNVGIRRPDLVAYESGGRSVVLDVTIVADNADLEAEFRHKVSLYDRPEIRSYVHHLSSSETPVEFGAIVLNWRGAMSQSTASVLTRVGIDQRSLGTISIRCVEGSFQIYVHFQRSTYRIGGRTGGRDSAFRSRM